MSHVVIGFFDSGSEAKEAMDKLVEDGYARENMDISSRSNRTGSVTAGEDNQPEKKESGLTRFFKTLFGSDDDAEKYSNVALETGTVVTVYTFSVEEAARAADILDENGAVDVNERASRFSNNRGQLGETADLFSPGDMRANTSAGRQDPLQKEQQQRDQTTPTPAPETPRVKEENWAGIGESETAGLRQKSRIIPWKGQASASLREDRLNETKIW